MKELFLSKNNAFLAMFVRRTNYGSGMLMDTKKTFEFDLGSSSKHPSENFTFSNIASSEVQKVFKCVVNLS